jgi:hypothetical protein
MRPLQTVTPAVTCTVQSTFTTGLLPSGHGCVANGWYFRDLSEIWLWRQSNRLVEGEKIWETARRHDPSFTCAKLFWWYNMYSSADYTVTPRPMYPADGRKLPDIYTQPAELRDALTRKLGRFRCSNSGGRTRTSSRRAGSPTARGGARRVRAHAHARVSPAPRLRAAKARAGRPGVGGELRAVDEQCGRLIERAERDGTRIVVLSEYGITPVDGSVSINRVLRQAGLLRVRDELGHELLDTGASEAFAVADHQIAHVYVARSEHVSEVKSLLERLPGVEVVLDAEGNGATGSTIRARESSSRSAARTAGSLTTTGSTTSARPTSRAPSRSTESPATTRSSCSSTPSCGFPSSRSRGGCCARPPAFAR